MVKFMKKTINEEELRHVARVARLELSDEEVVKLTKELGSVLDWFNELSSIDTKGIKPSFHPTMISNIMREDKPEKCWGNETALSNAKNKEKGHFKAPKIV